MPVNDPQKLVQSVKEIFTQPPWFNELEWDASGWITVDQLLAKLSAYPNISKEDIMKAAVTHGREDFEVKNATLRPLFLDQLSEHAPALQKPFANLYYGGNFDQIEVYKEHGLTPQPPRRFVHLVNDMSRAGVVAMKKASHPAILKVEADRAYADGIRFYELSDGVWWSESVPYKFLDLVE